MSQERELISPLDSSFIIHHSSLDAMPDELIALFAELEKRLPTVTQGQLVDTVRVRLATTIAQGAYILAMWPDLNDEEKLQHLDLVHSQLETQIMMLKAKSLYPETPAATGAPAQAEPTP